MVFIPVLLTMKLGKGFGEEIIREMRGRRRPGAAGGHKELDEGVFLSAPPFIGREDTLREKLPWRLLPLRLFLVFFFLLFLVRLFSLQIIEGRKYLNLSEGNRRRYEYLPAARGVIFDRFGEVLVRNAPAFKIVWTAASAEGTAAAKSDLAAARAAHLLGLSLESIKEKVQEAGREGEGEVVLRRGLTRDEAVEMEKTLSYEELPLAVAVDNRRDYLYDEVLAHVLGYLGEISSDELRESVGENYHLGELVGKDGLEKVYEKYLRGKSGRRLLETTAKGAISRELRRDEPYAGNDLTTTLDLSLSRKAYDILQEAVSKTGASGGAVVAQDPRNGEILISLSYPSFSPGLFTANLPQIDYQRLVSDPRKPLFDRTIAGAYPPGSVFKLVTAAAALQEKVVDANTAILDKGAISVGSFIYRDWKEGGHGLVKIRQALAESCDTYFYVIGGGYDSQMGVGPEKIAAWARRFRLGTLLGVDLPGEVKGLIGDPEWKKRVKGENWYIGNTYHMSIGQGDILTTPLQINGLTAALANGGTLYRPHFLAKIQTADGTLVKEAAPEILAENLLSGANVKLIREGMAGANEPGGTAYPMQGFPLKSGGKTGTAEFEIAGKTHAWYTAFAPYDQPEMALTVLLEGGGEGSRDAAPVARKILEEWLKGRGK